MIKITRLNIREYGYEYTFLSEKLAIEKSLSFVFKGSHYSPLVREGKWDGYNRYFNKNNESFSVGMLNIVIENLQNKKIDFGVNEKNFAVSNLVKADIGDNMMEHQKEALLKIFKERFGIVKSPVRSGKTYIFSEFCRIALSKNKNERILFITDGASLFEQSLNDINSFLFKHGINVGGIRGKRFEQCHVVVATIQTLEVILNGKSRGIDKIEDAEIKKITLKERNARKRILLNYFSGVTSLFVDECHEQTSTSRISIIEKLQKNQLNYNIFLSATPFKSEDLKGKLNMMQMGGDVIFEMEEEELKERGVLSRDAVCLIYINHDLNKNIEIEEGEMYRAYEKQVLTHNIHRNMLITTVVEMCNRFNLKTLVLFVIKQHGQYLSNMTGYEFLDGSFSIKQRIAITAKFLKSIGGVLLASNIFKKGITLPEVEVMINAGGGLERANVTQKKGRVLGVTATKNKVLTIDFFDDFRYFKKHGVNRVKEYEEKVPSENIFVFDSADKDFFVDLRNFIEDWFNK
jgi:superfamily II DNA or RNA helicase